MKGQMCLGKCISTGDVANGVEDHINLAQLLQMEPRCMGNMSLHSTLVAVDDFFIAIQYHIRESKE
jgi:hypothetical protein